MRKGRILMPLLSLILLGLLVFMIIGEWNPASWMGQFWTSKTSVALVEEELQKLAVLNTAEYRMRMIFPYDFIDGPAEWVMYKNLWELNPDLFDEKTDPSRYEDGVLPIQWKNALFYRECREGGIDPYNFRYDFLVFSVVLKAGTDLDSISDRFDGPVDNYSLEDDWIQQLPDPVITELVIEDLDNRQWGYPDPAVSPEEFRSLVEFLSPYMQQIAVDEGILDQALQSREDLLSGFISRAQGVY